MQKYSKAEVALHSSKKDCWVVINGKVYDVTSFLMDHPGGYDIILHASASGDAAQLFEEVGHSKAAIRRREGYLIGVIEGVHENDEKATAVVPNIDKAVQAKKTEKHSYTASLYDNIVPILMALLGFFALYFANIYERAKA